MSSISKLIHLTKLFNINTSKTITPSRCITKILGVAMLCSSPQYMRTPVYGGYHDMQKTREINTTRINYDVMEFLDRTNNWSENEVKVGRAWKPEELRIKSNRQLHQLWYVLLKERNMLLTMEHEYSDKMELFPSPERIDKVEVTMKNLEKVVRERNRAYHLLETGETGERPTKLVSNPLGINYNYKYCEHKLSPNNNIEFVKSRHMGCSGHAFRKFLLLYKEKLYNEKRKAKNRSRNEVILLLRRDPHLNIDMLRNKFLGIDIDKLKKFDKIRGHVVPKLEE